MKVISRLLLSLPAGHEYRIIFMQRPLPEVLASQDEMLRRRGTYKEGANPAAISAAFEKHLREVYAWLDGKSYVKTMPHAISRGAEQSKRDWAAARASFWGASLDLDAMAQQVDASLYRNRAK